MRGFFDVLCEQPLPVANMEKTQYWQHREKNWPNAIGYSGHCGQDMSRNAIGYLVGDTDGGRQRAEETSFYPAILM